DADGFDVLARLRQHAVLKSVPVVMITAEATREAVLKGLQAGADGYITKPVEPDWGGTAVRQGVCLTPRESRLATTRRKLARQRELHALDGAVEGMHAPRAERLELRDQLVHQHLGRRGPCRDAHAALAGDPLGPQVRRRVDHVRLRAHVL